MRRSSLSKIVALCLMLPLAACASVPRSINDVCAVFAQNDGWLSNWRREAYRAEAKYGVPAPILMATIRKESGFRSNARPPRTKLLGFIPWKRKSSAYGYSQALNATWSQYMSETGNFTARRGSFADSIDFVGWYHAKSANALGIARNDAFRLYLAYYHGWGGYRRGDWQNNAAMQKYARETAEMARTYAAQMRRCR
jgi:hypothetical protein